MVCFIFQHDVDSPCLLPVHYVCSLLLCVFPTMCLPYHGRFVPEYAMCCVPHFYQCVCQYTVRCVPYLY